MRNQIIGIIAEGKDDQMVIRNILRAFGFDGNLEVKNIRPSLATDYTTQATQQQTIGTLQGVKNACILREDFDIAFANKDINFMVIQMDTAEIDYQDFIFVKPQKTDIQNYATELRNKTIDQMNEWLQNNYTEKLFYAITIEEIEAWLLTLFENTETTKSAKPKEKLFNNHFGKIENKTYAKISEPFKKLKDLKNYAKNNISLNEFVIDLEKKFM